MTKQRSKKAHRYNYSTTVARRQAPPRIRIHHAGVELLDRSQIECNRFPSTSQQLPKWVDNWKKADRNWRGLAIWSRSAEKLERFSAGEALVLLRMLRGDLTWQTEGFHLTLRTQVPPPKAEQTNQPSPKPVLIQEERASLPPPAAAALQAFLQEHESLLKEMAEEDEREAERAMQQAFGILWQFSRKSEAQEIDLASRPLPWVRSKDSITLTCNQPPNRGTITLMDNGWFWQACIERPRMVKQSGGLHAHRHLVCLSTFRDHGPGGLGQWSALRSPASTDRPGAGPN